MMNRPQVPLITQLRVSIRGLGRVFASPLYTGLSLLTTFVTLGIVIWFPNWRLLREIFRLPQVGLGDKVAFYLEGYEALATNYEGMVAISLLIMAVLFGVSVALMIAIGINRAGSLSSGSGLLSGILGAGCAACGTSLVAPVLGAVGAGSAFTLTQTLGMIANLLAIVLLCYSIFKLGIQAASTRP